MQHELQGAQAQTRRERQGTSRRALACSTHKKKQEYCKFTGPSAIPCFTRVAHGHLTKPLGQVGLLVFWRSRQSCTPLSAPTRPYAATRSRNHTCQAGRCLRRERCCKNTVAGLLSVPFRCFPRLRQPLRLLLHGNIVRVTTNVFGEHVFVCLAQALEHASRAAARHFACIPTAHAFKYVASAVHNLIQELQLRALHGSLNNLSRWNLPFVARHSVDEPFFKDFGIPLMCLLPFQAAPVPPVVSHASQVPTFDFA